MAGETSSSAKRRPSPAADAKGFTLVELMVGMAVGLALILIVSQSYTMYEGMKRTTTGGADATENGLMALRTLQADIRQGGAGFVTGDGLACPSYVNGNGAANPLFPVQIIDGGTGSDTIVVNYGNSSAGGNSGMALLPPVFSAGSAIAAVQMPPNLGAGNDNMFNNNDIILFADPGSLSPCTMMQISSFSSFGATRITASAYPASTVYSPPAGLTYGPGEGSTGGFVFDMGSMVSNQYQILSACNALVVSNALPGAPAPSCTMNPETFVNTSAVADNIVALQAQYGIAPTGSQTVSCWVNATTGNACDNADWSQTGLLATPSNIQRIKAIRVAVVSRSNQMEKGLVTSTCTSAIAANANNGPCVWPDVAANQPAPVIDLSGNTNWKNYRYRVFTTIIPLKNVIWAGI